jgi:RNAse (barnase) inhibitor barstar
MTVDELRRRHPGLRVIAPARTKDALLAAIYLALDAPDYAGGNYDALNDVLNDLSWLPAGPVHLAWVANPALPPGVRRSVDAIVDDAVRDSARSPRPLRVYRVTG